MKYPLIAVVMFLAVVVGGLSLVIPPRGLLQDGDRVTSISVRASSVQLHIVRGGRTAVVTYAIPSDK
jgi:hypothetical protein